jgi:hypothetical protein
MHPNPNELSRRQAVVQDWAALQTRRRHARAAVLVMIAALLFASTGVLLVYRFTRVRHAPGGSAASADFSSSSPTP